MSNPIRPADDEPITIQVEVHRNSQSRVYNTNVELCTTVIAYYSYPLRPYQMGMPEVGVGDVEVGHNITRWSQLGDTGRALVSKLLAIPGVTELFLKPYDAHVIIAPAFKWEKVGPKVLDVFREVFNTTELIIESNERHSYVGGDMPCDPFSEEPHGLTDIGE